MNLKTVLLLLSFAFILSWIIEDPAAASHVVHNTGTFITSMAHGISGFFASL